MPLPPRQHAELSLQAERSRASNSLLLPMSRFIHVAEIAGGPLIIAAGLALLWANIWSDFYHTFWHQQMVLDIGIYRFSESLQHVVNDLLMPVFFFVAGMEIKRAVTRGELSTWKRAALPVAAAIGGMLIPALTYVAFTFSAGTMSGWGVPVATDIAFALAVLAVLGDRVPSQLKMLVLAFAIADDIGGILVIAFFYTDDISWWWLAGAVVVTAVLTTLAALRLDNRVAYGILAVALWLTVFESGVHATIAGVILGVLVRSHAKVDERQFTNEAPELIGRIETALAAEESRPEEAHEAHGEPDPDRREHALGRLYALVRATEPPVDRLLIMTNPWVSYIVLPAFALANAGIVLSVDKLTNAATDLTALGVLAGLLLGKPVGFLAAAFVALKTNFAESPDALTWRHLIGAGLLAAIGFTVAIFIAELAFDDEQLRSKAKIGILTASVVSAIAGYLFLFFGGKSQASRAQ